LWHGELLTLINGVSKDDLHVSSNPHKTKLAGSILPIFQPISSELKHFS
jgi:hypothetical protein